MSTLCVTPLSELSLDKLGQATHQALKDWDHSKTTGHVLGHLRLFHNKQRYGGCEESQVGRVILEEALKTLEYKDRVIDKEYKDAWLLAAHYQEHVIAEVLMRQLNIQEAGFFRRLAKARKRLAEVIYQMEVNAHIDHRLKQLNRLEIPAYQNLVGLDAYLCQLKDLLIKPGAPFLVALKGPGGIGKTTSADALDRLLIAEDAFDDTAWISAKPVRFTMGGGLRSLGQPTLTEEAFRESLFDQLLPDVPKPTSFSNEATLALLERRLKACPCLVVIDNLEAIVDIEHLFTTLQRLINPSKFLLTTRERLPDEAGIVAHVDVPELNQHDAITLIRQTAQENYLQHVLDAHDEELLPIYEIVGGNPLALRLVTGQLQTHELDEVLSDLQQARSEPVENLYSFLFRHAWDRLDETSRRVLLAMPLLSDPGGTVDLLQQITEMEAGKLRTALNKLVALSLIDSRGGLRERLFSIHNLTKTFLHQQVLQWT